MTELCVNCETGTATEVVRNRVVLLHGRELHIADDRFMKCDTCGEEYYTDEQSRDYVRKVNDARRRDESLLTGEQIQRLRRSLLLSQAQLEDALGVSHKTVVRWETGTAVQSKALDDVLRLIALDPDNLRLLVRIRHAALSQVLEEKLAPQDDIRVGELSQAVYAGLERVSTLERASLETSLVDEITKSVVAAIMEHRRERVERSIADVSALAV